MAIKAGADPARLRACVTGSAEILQVYAAALRATQAEHAEATVLTVNWQPALAAHENGILRSRLVLPPDANGLIRWICTIRNSDKLLPDLRL